MDFIFDSRITMSFTGNSLAAASSASTRSNWAKKMQEVLDIIPSLDDFNARKLLIENNWDVEAAINAHFNTAAPEMQLQMQPQQAEMQAEQEPEQEMQRAYELPEHLKHLEDHELYNWFLSCDVPAEQAAQWANEHIKAAEAMQPDEAGASIPSASIQAAETGHSNTVVISSDEESSDEDGPEHKKMKLQELSDLEKEVRALPDNAFFVLMMGAPDPETAEKISQIINKIINKQFTSDGVVAKGLASTGAMRGGGARGRATSGVSDNFTKELTRLLQKSTGFLGLKDERDGFFPFKCAEELLAFQMPDSQIGSYDQICVVKGRKHYLTTHDKTSGVLSFNWTYAALNDSTFLTPQRNGRMVDIGVFRREQLLALLDCSRERQKQFLECFFRQKDAKYRYFMDASPSNACSKYDTGSICHLTPEQIKHWNLEKLFPETWKYASEGKGRLNFRTEAKLHTNNPSGDNFLNVGKQVTGAEADKQPLNFTTSVSSEFLLRPSTMLVIPVVSETNAMQVYGALGECSICFGEYGSAESFAQCGHGFCKTCMPKLKKCALCREPIVSRTVLGVQDTPQKQNVTGKVNNLTWSIQRQLDKYVEKETCWTILSDSDRVNVTGQKVVVGNNAFYYVHVRNDTENVRTITPVFCEGDKKEAEDPITLQPNETWLTPFPLQRNMGEETTDSWVFLEGENQVLKISFRQDDSIFQRV